MKKVLIILVTVAAAFGLSGCIMVSGYRPHARGFHPGPGPRVLVVDGPHHPGPPPGRHHRY